MFAFLVFIPDSSEMSGIFYHTFHVARGVFGIIVMRKLPTVSTIVEGLPNQRVKVPFD